MKRLVGFIIFTQTIVFGLLIFELHYPGNSILQATAFATTRDGIIAWNDNLSLDFLIPLFALLILGSYLIFSKNENKSLR